MKDEDVGARKTNNRDDLAVLIPACRQASFRLHPSVLPFPILPILSIPVAG